MPLIALALASASSLHAAVDPPANPQLHVENRVLLGSNESTSTMKSIIGKADGTVSINVEVDTGDEEDFDVNALLSQLGNAKGDMKIVIVGPDGKEQVIERELTGIDTLVDQIDVGDLLERIDLNALMQQARGDEHGNHDHGHGGHHGEGHDDDPERFFRASESFIEQLHHARAVAKQLNNGEATALLAIWYASEHMEPNQCLELMDNIMNDDTLMPTVRRAAAFTGVQLAMESGDEHLAGRILGSIVRGAGMKNEARRNREHATETDRAPNGQRDRSPQKQSRDRS